MKVVILCGGLGTRLQEETEFRPKPMVNIGTHPILWHIMKIYSHFGHHEFVLSLGYKSEMVKEYFYHYELINNDITLKLSHPRQMQFHQSHDENNWVITMVNTGRNALKGARLKRVENFIDGNTFMMTYGDGVADIDIDKLLAFHRKHGKIATVTGVNTASQFGELKIRGNRVERFREKPVTASGLISGGFFVFNRKFFRYLTDDDNCDLEIGPLEKIAAAGQLMVYRHRGNWACMDTIRDVDYLNRLWNENKAFWKNW